MIFYQFNLSNSTTNIFVASMGVDLPCQRLFFRGKQLEKEQTLFDYSINDNDVIQLMIRQPLVETQDAQEPLLTPKEEPSDTNVEKV